MGLVYVDTGKRLKKWWRHNREADDSFCECGIAQTAAHLLECPKIADGKGGGTSTGTGIPNREASEDPDWCRAVAES